MKLPTQTSHPPVTTPAANNRPLVSPIYQSVKFAYPDVAATREGLSHDGYFYSRSSNPTTRQLELSLARLQGRDDAVVCASGVGAIAQTLFSLLQQGDHVLCFGELYGPTRTLIRRTLARYGVTHTLLSIQDDADIERVLAGTPTRLVIFESPTNPVTRIADIARITAAARRHGALTLLDNTLAGPHQHGQYDVDYFLHSLTKYVSGHGDVMGGAVIANTGLLAPVRRDFSLFGGTLDPHAAYLMQRGLKTYLLRYEAQTRTAQQLAEAISDHPAVACVHYPGLPQHPRHALACEQMQHFGTVVSFDLHADRADRFTDALRLFAIAPSMGSAEALVMPPSLAGGFDLPPDLQARCGMTTRTVRLSMGLEDADDLIADVQQALHSIVC